jgi:hypothetical protein
MVKVLRKRQLAEGILISRASYADSPCSFDFSTLNFLLPQKVEDEVEVLLSQREPCNNGTATSSVAS